MSELLREYDAIRHASGAGHYAAIRELARRIDVDAGTVERVLKRAEKHAGRAWGPGRTSGRPKAA